MAVHLTKEDFDQLVKILGGVTQFRSVDGRARLVASALEGSPDADQILGLLNLDGAPLAVAGDVIRELAKFGRVTPDQEALGILLNYLLAYSGASEQTSATLRGLIDKYQMDRPLASRPEVSGWKEDSKEGALRQERIIGENNLRDVRILQLAMEASRGVLLITTPHEKGSGFLVGPDLVMTNHHVIADQAKAEASKYLFNFQLNRERQFDSLACVTALPQAGGLFYSNEALDFAVLQLQPIPAAAQAQALLPRRLVPQSPERVIIIQHPYGQYKQLAMQNNFVSHYEKPWLRYTTSTDEGSSGSPVFNEEFEVVAIHHGSREFLDPATQKPYVRNEGAAMTVVLDDLKANAPAIYARINKK